VVADIYMLGVFFLNHIRGNKDCPLVVSAEWNGCDIIS
jgi:hypothetical protein